jgi:periplasmic protein TonB
MTSTTLPKSPAITSGDRMSFSVFLAAAFHALVLLGIGFALPDTKPPEYERTMDVTLATEFSEVKPDEADFLGQADQQGGGDLDEVARPSTTEVSPFPNQQMEQLTSPQQQEVSQPKVEQQTLIASDNSTKLIDKVNTQLLDPQKRVESITSESLYSDSLEIASLTAQLEAEKQFQAKNPRKRQVSAAIHRASDALYLDAWRRKIERIGNLNYPEKAKRDGIFGSLSLKVAINKNGSINDIVILRTSGHKVLDDAAIRIVRLAAPFAPLTKEMTKDTDILEVVRVWRFQPDNSLNAR